LAADARTAILWVWEGAERAPFRESNSWTKFERCSHYRSVFFFNLSKLSTPAYKAVLSNLLQHLIVDLLVNYEATSVRELHDLHIKQSSDSNSVPACLTE
jgi:hypothetical protein